MDRTEKGIRGNLGQKLLEDAIGYVVVYRSSGFTQRSSIAMVFDPSDALSFCRYRLPVPEDEAYSSPFNLKEYEG